MHLSGRYWTKVSEPIRANSMPDRLSNSLSGWIKKPKASQELVDRHGVFHLACQQENPVEFLKDGLEVDLHFYL